MSTTTFDLHVAAVCPTEFREMVQAANKYADLLARYLADDPTVSEAQCIEAKSEKINAENSARKKFQKVFPTSHIHRRFQPHGIAAS